MNLIEQERDAYQRGDTETAEILARLIDAENDSVNALTEAEKRAQDAEKRLERLASCVADATERLDRLHDNAPEGRITKAEFSAILAELEDISQWLEDAQTGASA